MGALTTQPETALESFFRHESLRPRSDFLLEPGRDGQLVRYSWAEVGDQARRIARYLQSLDLPAASNIGLLAKNCAHWIIADLAIWMAGHVSVPLHPHLTPDAAGKLIEHAAFKCAINQPQQPGAFQQPGKGLVRGALQDIAHVFADIRAKVVMPGCISVRCNTIKQPPGSIGNFTALKNVGWRKHRPDRRLITTPGACMIGRGQTGNHRSRRLVAPGNHIGRMIAVTFKGDIDCRRSVVARRQ